MGTAARQRSEGKPVSALVTCTLRAWMRHGGRQRRHCLPRRLCDANTSYLAAGPALGIRCAPRFFPVCPDRQKDDALGRRVSPPPNNVLGKSFFSSPMSQRSLHSAARVALLWARRGYSKGKGAAKRATLGEKKRQKGAIRGRERYKKGPV